jgi:hypothetical protein
MGNSTSMIVAKNVEMTENVEIAMAAMRFAARLSSTGTKGSMQ